MYNLAKYASLTQGYTVEGLSSISTYLTTIQAEVVDRRLKDCLQLKALLVKDKLLIQTDQDEGNTLLKQLLPELAQCNLTREFEESKGILKLN